MIKDTLLKDLNLNIDEQTPLVIGCSAGPDSMALLHFLHTHANNPLIVTHINHNIRKQSIEEEEYLSTFCLKNKITFETNTIKNYTENNFENEARKKRYEFYEKILNKYNTKYLFLAHHGDDLVETILMKIARGSNLEGYAGIKAISKKNNYLIIRPFLSLTKEDLINYNNKHKIKYYIDHTNEDTTYTRNRYRKKILPQFKEENPNIHLNFLKYSNTLLEYNTYIEEETNKIYHTIIKNNALNIELFKELHPFIQKNLLYKYLSNYYQNKINIIKEKHIINILNIISNNKPNITINLPLNTQIRKTYNNLYIEKKKENNNNNYKLELKEINNINNITIVKLNKENYNTNYNGNDICRLDSSKISLPLYIRNRKEGDYIETLSLNGRKKIKEIFIEHKIPKQNRDNYPILVDNNNTIIWLPNLKKSKFNSQRHEFYDIILKYCEKEENNEQ